MGENREGVDTLSEEQRRLVRENLGLVGVHLRRFARDVDRPRHDREWDDLFQEGVLGLIQAAKRYKPERGIPFAAFAIRRIHNSVSRALQTRFSTVYIPPVDSRAKKRHARGEASHVPTPRPKVQSLPEELADRAATACPDSLRVSDAETIGDRLRAKYERAVRKATEKLAAALSRRGDREKLVRILAEERYLVPHEECRRRLRRIAEETKSSFSRVSDCNRQLGKAIGYLLDFDPEFRELRRRSRTHPDGIGLVIDEELDQRLRDAAAQDFLRRFRLCDSADRGRMLDELLGENPVDLEDLVRHRFSTLDAGRRERLLTKTGGDLETRRSRAGRHDPRSSLSAKKVDQDSSKCK